MSEDLAIDVEPLATSDPSRKPRLSQWLQVSVLAAPIAFLAVVAWLYRSMLDDGYIYLHVVQNILAGNGPVFNAGQRVEVFTGPLWTGILALAGFVTPFPLEWIAVVLGIAMTLSGLTLATVGSSRLARSASHAFLLPLGAITFVAVFPVWTYASMGLETGLTFLWLGGCLAILVRWSNSGQLGRLAMITLGLGPLVRPELLIDSAVFVITILAVESRNWTWRDRAQLFAWAAALPIAYQIFRMGYYGEFVANTAIAKEGTLPRPGRGFHYLMDFVGPYWLIVPGVALAAGAYVPLTRAFRGERRLWALLALPLAGILDAGYITLMGGDYLHGRLLMPAFFAMCAPVATVPVARRYLFSFTVLPWAIVALIFLRPPVGDLKLIPPFWFITGNGKVTPAEQGWALDGPYMKWYTGKGLFANLGISPTATRQVNVPLAQSLHLPTVAVGGIGEIAYVLGTNVNVFDVLGLANPLAGHMAPKTGVLSGHEKFLPTPWIAAMLTAPESSTAPWEALQAQVPLFMIRPVIPQTTGAALAAQTEWARAALTCPPIHNIAYGQDQPLTFTGFLSNIVHSIGNSQLRIPPNPETAYHQFCGADSPVEIRFP